MHLKLCETEIGGTLFNNNLKAESVTNMCFGFKLVSKFDAVRKGENSIAITLRSIVWYNYKENHKSRPQIKQMLSFYRSLQMTYGVSHRGY